MMIFSSRFFWRAPGLLFFLALSLFLGGCTRIADWIGLPEDRGVVNPILIPNPPPLTMPPELFLRPPAKSAPAQPPPTDKARNLLQPQQTASKERALSEGEKRLLQRLKASEALDNIRALLDQDAKSRAYQYRDSLAILNALAEARRLEKSQKSQK